MRSAVVLALLGLAACLGDLEAPGTPPPNVDPQLGCTLTCHGSDTSNAPPRDLSGRTETSFAGVGAHRQHLDPAPTWHRAVACADCHAVPPRGELAGAHG